MPDRAHRNGPAKPYHEAFPSLGINDVVQAWHAGQQTCEWVNESGLVVGHARVTELSNESVVFDQSFFGSVNITRGGRSIRIATGKHYQNEYYYRPDFVCPACLQTVSTIYYVWDEWRCLGCHGLTYLTRRLTPVLRKVRRRDEVAAFLAEQDNKRSRQYLNNERKLGKLDRALLDAGVSCMPEPLRYRTIGRWLLPGQLPQEYRSERLADAGWQSGHQGGFAWFRETDRPISTKAEANLNVTGCELVGVPLFQKPLSGLFDTKMDELLADTAMQPKSRSARQNKIMVQRFRASATITPLILRPLHQLPNCARSEDGIPELIIDLEYTGDDRLWGHCSEPEVGQSLKGVFPADGVLRLVVRFPAGREAAARHLLATSLAHIRACIVKQTAMLHDFADIMKIAARELPSLITN